MSIRILTPGLQTSVQDFGRAGHRHLGVPLSGAADKLSLALANFCVGNRANTAGLEITLTGPELEFESGVDFAFSGAPINVKLNGKLLTANRPYSAAKGDRLNMGSVTSGARAYITFTGGIKAAQFLGSQSTYSYANIGGHEGRYLQAGDQLQFGPSQDGTSQSLQIGFAPRISDTLILRAQIGPEWEHMTVNSQRKICSKPFLAGPHTDRMGTQLSGPHLALGNKTQMISSAILPGTLQVPQSGDAILMGADGHCTGGYPRALQIIRADRHMMGQIKPGTQIHFVKIEDGEARDILKKRTALFQTLMPDFAF